MLGLTWATVTTGVQDCGLVILNGRVIAPETMLDAVMNVGVKDGKIAAITGKDCVIATTNPAGGNRGR